MAVPVVTQLGVLFGRDAVYLERLVQEGPRLEIVGEINGQLCEPHGQDAWFRYRLVFSRVASYECQGVDDCRWETKSSFDEEVAVSSESEGSPRGRRTFYLSTYDYAFRVVAQAFDLEILGERPRVRRRRTSARDRGVLAAW